MDCSTPASLSIANSRSLLKLVSIEAVTPSNHLTLCRPLLPLPSILPSIRVFSNEPVLCIRWPKYWSFSFRICPSNEYSGLISFRTFTSRTQSPLQKVSKFSTNHLGIQWECQLWFSGPWVRPEMLHCQQASWLLLVPRPHSWVLGG